MRQAWIGVSCVLFGLSLVACDQGSDEIGEQFMVQLSGANEVPARGTAANGVIGVNVRGNRVDYSIEVHGISAITGAHFHSGAAGVNGPIRIALYPGPGSNFSTTPSGAFDGQFYEGSFEASGRHRHHAMKTCWPASARARCTATSTPPRSRAAR